MRRTKLTTIETVRAMLLCAAVVLCLRSVHSDESRFSYYATAGTADIHRGLLRHDKPVALQAAARFAASDAISLGVAVHDAEFAFGAGSVSDETEVNYSVAYARQVSQDYAWQAKFTRYTFPGSSNAFFEYDFNELSIYFELPRHISLALSVSDSQLNFTKGLAYGELSWRKAVPFELELSAAIGATKALSQSRQGYAYWDVGLSRFVGPLAVDLRYHYSPYDRSWFGRAPASGEWVLSLTHGL